MPAHSSSPPPPPPPGSPAPATAPRRSAADRQRGRTSPATLLAGGDMLMSEREAALLRQGQQMFERYKEHRSKRIGPARAGRKLSDQSIATYREMWEPFATYCAFAHIDPATITEDELERYLASRQPRRKDKRDTAADRAGATIKPVKQRAAVISARHGYRILALIDKVLRVYAHGKGEEPNPVPAAMLAKPPYATINAPDKAGLPGVLTSRQIEVLISVCTQRLLAGRDAPTTWAEVRDRAAILLQLGTGITPLEVRRLQLRHVLLDERDQPERLSLDATDTFGQRQVPIALAEAARLLDYWLDVRDTAGIEGDYLFPSRASGTQWSEASLLKQTRIVFKKAGLEHLPGGGYRLRHTYILRRLKVAKLPPETVATLVGIKEVEEMAARYQGLQIE